MANVSIKLSAKRNDINGVPRTFVHDVLVGGLEGQALADEVNRKIEATLDQMFPQKRGWYDYTAKIGG